jgi:hypothetical protein
MYTRAAAGATLQNHAREPTPIASPEATPYPQIPYSLCPYVTTFLKLRAVFPIEPISACRTGTEIPAG